MHSSYKRGDISYKNMRFLKPICIYIYIYIYIYMYVCVYTHTYMHAHIHIHTHFVILNIIRYD